MADPLLGKKTTWETLRDLPRPAVHLALAFGEAYVLVNYFADHLEGYSVRALAWRLYLVHLVLQYIWNSVIFPNFFGPFRHLPRPKEWITADAVLFRSPRGVDCLRWMKEIPNEGLIGTRDFTGQEFPLITSPQVYADVLVNNSYDYIKPWYVRKFMSRILGWGLISVEGDVHRAQRRSIMPAFQLKSIRSLYPLMWEKSMLLTDVLEKEIRAGDRSKLATGDIEISSWASRLTLDIIGPAAMGRDFRSLQENDHLVAKNYLELLQPNLRFLLYFVFALLTPPWMSENLPSPVNVKITRIVQEVREVCRDIITEKKQEIIKDKAQDSSQDILSTMLRGKDLPDDVCIDQMLTFLAAGHETTANALSWTCYLLCKHSHYQAALCDELLQAIPDPTQPVGAAELENLPLLNGICNEVLRLYPTVPMTTRAPARDVILANTIVPKGTWLMFSIWATNRDPSLWGSDPDEFRPERWIDIVDDEKAADGSGKKQRFNGTGGSTTNYAMMTFLHGPRSCIGQGFARAELRCAVAALFGRFAIRLQRPNEEITSVGAVTPKPKGGINLRMTVRPGWCVEP